MKKSKITKEQLLEKASYLFRTKGYHQTSIHDIANECNLSKASIYHHSPSKKDLALEVLKKLHQHFREQIFTTAYQENIPAEQRLENFSLQLEEFFIDRQGGCIMGNFTLEVADDIPEFAELLRTYFKEWMDATSHILKNFTNEQQANLVAEDYISHFQGALMVSRLYNDYTPLRRIREQLRQSINSKVNEAALVG